MITNGGYDKQTAANAIRTGAADAIVFGQYFIANPDQLARIRIDAPLNSLIPETFYGPSDSGYIDYPFLNQKPDARL